MNKHNKHIKFVLDNEIVSIDFNKDPHLKSTTTLLKYLRLLPNHKGTKEGCAEGDCGACTVVLVELNNDNTLEYKAVNSCLVFLPMIHGKQVITVENLEESGKLHPIQKSFIENHASQCGFCTPGFVMSTFSVYKSGNLVTDTVIKDSLAGNLCRCTGYRPIFDAAKEAISDIKPDHFSNDEELTKNQLLEIKAEKGSILIEKGKQIYFLPFKLTEALDYKLKHSDAIIINGATDTALRVTKKNEFLPHIIDISHIDELKEIIDTKDSIIIGANLNLNDLRDLVALEFEALYDILNVFGSKQIRNLAGLGGNIASASPIGDTLPVLMAYNASVILLSAKGKREIRLEDFIIDYRKTSLADNEIIKSVRLPKTPNNLFVKAYKISKRKDLDISSVSAGFRVILKNNIVNEIALFFGGMAAKAVRAKNTEQFLHAKKWTLENIEAARRILFDEFKPLSDARAEAEGRKIMAANLLKQFWLDSIVK